jgi:hypothetical protein
MKSTKRLLAILLVFLLTFGFAMPAIAEEEPPEEPLSAVPVITVQPQGGSARGRNEFTLTVEAYIPNGSPLAYQWYRVVQSEHRARTGGKNLTVSGWGETHTYFVRVFNAANPDFYVISETATVEFRVTFGCFIREWFGRAFEFVTHAAMQIVIFPIGIVIALVVGLGSLIRG